MPAVPGAHDHIRFGRFVVSRRTRELLKDGRLIKLPGVPFEVLTALLERPGELVTREELRARLWPDGTFVDFDNNLNNAVNRLRQALGDSAERPQYIETLPRLGYRFVGELGNGHHLNGAEVSDIVMSAPKAPSQSADVPVVPTVATEVITKPRARRQILGLTLLGAFLIASLAAWRWLSIGSAPADGKVMMVVLPFENLSAESDQQYLADGFTEQLITELARFAPAELGVIARTTSFTYKHATRSVTDVAKDLGVDFVVEGSVQRDGERLRVTAQLIEPRNQTHVWAESYDRDLNDLLVVERDVSRAVAAAVRLAVTPAQPSSPPMPAVSADARDAYLQARYFSEQATVPSIEKAIGFYRKAVEVEPGFALAYAGLARVLIFSTSTAPNVALASARQATERALHIDPNLPEAQLASAMVRLYHERDLETSEREFQRALALDAGNADAHFYYAQLLTAMGRFDEALAEARRAQVLDPHSTLIAHYVGRILLFAHRPREAITELRGALDLDPNYGWAWLFLVVAHEQLGDWKEAVAARQKYWAVMGVPAERGSRLGELFSASGYDAVRREWIDWIEGFAKQRGFVTSTELAILYAALGENDQALRWLRMAYDSQTRDLIYTNVYPELDSLRADPRFQEIASLIFPGGR